MKIELIITVLFLCVLTTFGQEENQALVAVKLADQFARYPSGDKGLHNFIQENNRWNNSNSQEECLSFVSFLVKSDGSVDSISVLRNNDMKCDEEAIRIASLFEKFIPCSDRGVPLDCECKLTMKFRKYED